MLIPDIGKIYPYRFPDGIDIKQVPAIFRDQTVNKGHMRPIFHEA